MNCYSILQATSSCPVSASGLWLKVTPATTWTTSIRGSRTNFQRPRSGKFLFILKFYFIDWVRVAGFHIRLKLIGQWVCIPFSLRNETKRLLPNRRVVFQENLASESPLIRSPNRGKTRKLLNWYKQSRLTIIRRGRGNGKDLYSSDYSSNPVFKSTIFCCQIVVKKKRRLAHLKHNYL